MSATYNIRQTFIFSPPAEHANAWNLQLEGFTRQLEQGFPEAEVEHEEAGGCGPGRASPSSCPSPMATGSKGSSTAPSTAPAPS